MSRLSKVLPRTALRTIALAVLFMFTALAHPVQADDSKALRVGGTGTALGGMILLAEAFMKSHPDANVIVLPSLGSTGAIKALVAGKIDVAISARPLKEAERANVITDSEYARTPFIFATRHDTAAAGVTVEQLVRIYSGNSDTWPDGAQLRLIMRPANDSDIKLLSKFSPQMEKAVLAATQRPDLHVAVNAQENAAALEKIPGSLGLTTLAQIMTEEREVKILTLNGVAGTVEALRDGKHPFAKSLFLVVKSEPAPPVDAFIRFVRSAEGRAILTTTGHVVISPSEKPKM